MPRRQTLVESAAQALLAHLDSGRWTEHLPGERVLCKELQISRPTLRQALKALERLGRLQVAQGQQRRITGPPVAGIPASRRNVIGLLSPFTLKALPPFVMFWIDEVRSNLARVGCRLEFHANPAFAAHHTERALERVVYDAPAALWILLLSTPCLQQWFLRRKLPCLVAGSCVPGVTLPSVDVDYRAACRHAVGVFRRRGHNRLALVIPATGTGGDTESEAGFREASTGVPHPTILRHAGTREDIVRQVERSLGLASPPTGFLVARSAHALTVITLLMQRGLPLPSRVAVISRDDDAFLDFVTPSVACYKSDPEAFARNVSRIVLQMMRSGPLPVRPVRLMPKFVPGETV